MLETAAVSDGAVPRPQLLIPLLNDLLRLGHLLKLALQTLGCVHGRARLRRYLIMVDLLSVALLRLSQLCLDHGRAPYHLCASSLPVVLAFLDALLNFYGVVIFPGHGLTAHVIL